MGLALMRRSVRRASSSGLSYDDLGATWSMRPCKRLIGARATKGDFRDQNIS